MNAYGIYGPMSGLPDPELDRQFYAGVPARRLVAWLIDLVLRDAGRRAARGRLRRC